MLFMTFVNLIWILVFVKCAIELEDTKLIANLTPRDLVVQEAKYHHHCLITLYNPEN